MYVYQLPSIVFIDIVATCVYNLTFYAHTRTPCTPYVHFFRRRAVVFLERNNACLPAREEHAWEWEEEAVEPGGRWKGGREETGTENRTWKPPWGQWGLGPVCRERGGEQANKQKQKQQLEKTILEELHLTISHICLRWWRVAVGGVLACHANALSSLSLPFPLPPLLHIHALIISYIYILSLYHVMPCKLSTFPSANEMVMAGSLLHAYITPTLCISGGEGRR